jgi:hypothetical protein
MAEGEVTTLLDSAAAEVTLGRRVELTVRPESDAALFLVLRVTGSFRATVALTPAMGGGWQPLHVAVAGLDGETPLGYIPPSTARVFSELTARAGAMLVRLRVLPTARRLPRLVRWLCAYEDLFSAPCGHCGRMLDSADGTALALVPPTVRCSRGRAYHERCAEMCCGDVEAAWLQL